MTNRVTQRLLAQHGTNSAAASEDGAALNSATGIRPDWGIVTSITLLAGHASAYRDAAWPVFDVGMPVRSDDLIDDPEAHGMQRHPEGGWYRETWRHELSTGTPRGQRPLATCVSFLLLPGERSAWHRVSSAEMWLWQGGGPVLLTVGGFGDRPVSEFSCELSVGGQYLVRADEWQTAEPATDRAVLVACVVSPGFVFADFTLSEPVGPAS